MAEGAGLIRLALFGSPVRQSLSPRIHARFAEQVGLTISYRAFDTPAGTLARALRDFARAGGRGCNITLPLKAEALELARECPQTVRRAGTANTLLAIDPGAGDSEPGWRAENTDGAGLVSDLEASGAALAGQRLALVGAGGAAAGVLGALLERAPAKLTLFNRSTERAAALAQRYPNAGALEVRGWGRLDEAADFDVLINATSIGHQGLAPPVHANSLAAGGLCYDMNYGPSATPLRTRCAEHGLAYRDGLGMLVAQAAASFRLWTGATPDAATVLRELRQEA